MFQTKYYKEKDLYKIEILLSDVSVGVIESEKLKDAINTYIAFEEDYFIFKFSDKERELKTKNIELTMELQESRNEELLYEIVDINEELHSLYINSGFDQIRKQHEADYKLQLITEMNELGGDLDE